MSNNKHRPPLCEESTKKKTCIKNNVDDNDEYPPPLGEITAKERRLIKVPVENEMSSHIKITGMQTIQTVQDDQIVWSQMFSSPSWYVFRISKENQGVER